MRLHFAVVAAFLAAGSGSGQDIKPKVVERAEPGKIYLFELVGGAGKEEVLGWILQRGKGSIRMFDDRTRAELVPDPGNDVIIVVCNMLDGQGRPMKAQAEVRMAAPTSPATAPPAPPNQAPPGAAARADRPAAPPPQVPNAAAGDIGALGFLPAGFMGSAEKGEGVVLNQGNLENCPPGRATCIKITYAPQSLPPGSAGWFAIGWQYTSGEPNFGRLPGLNLEQDRAAAERFRSFRVRARGDLVGGRAPVVQFKSGGGTQPGLDAERRASYEVIDRFRPLSPNWTEYCLDLSRSRLTNVVSAFTLVLERSANPSGAAVYLDELAFSTRSCGGQ